MSDVRTSKKRITVTLTGREFKRLAGCKESLAECRKKLRQLELANRNLRERLKAAQKKAGTYAGIIRATSERRAT